MKTTSVMIVGVGGQGSLLASRLLGTLLTVNGQVVLVEGAAMTIEVASTNEKALRLYQKLGFLQIGEISRWYTVL